MSETTKRDWSEASTSSPTSSFFGKSSFIPRDRLANSLASSLAWSSRWSIWAAVSFSEGFGPDALAARSNTNNNVASTCFIDVRMACPRFTAGVVVECENISPPLLFARGLPQDNSLRAFSTTPMSGLMDSTGKCSEILKQLKQKSLTTYPTKPEFESSNGISRV